MADDPIRDLLERSKVIAVVGLSSKPHRPSYGVARYMQSAGYRIIPVNPNEREVLGEKCYARLEDVPIKVDIVDVFRRSELVPPVVESAIAIGARAVWLQEGVIHKKPRRAPETPASSWWPTAASSKSTPSASPSPLHGRLLPTFLLVPLHPRSD
jgi:predicted CoA-binding protein